MNRARLGAAAVLALLAPLAAAAAELPPAFAGVWSEDGCDRESRVRLVNALGILEFRELAGERQVQLALIEDVVPAPDGRAVNLVLRSPTEERLSEQQLALAGDRLDGGGIRCPSAPASLLLPFGEAIALFQAAGELKPLCAPGTDRVACFARAFRLTDLTGDGRLTLAELTRVARGLAFFVGYLAERRAIQPADRLAGPVAAAAWLGPSVIRPLVEGSDYDGDGALSAAELAQDRAAGDLPLPGAATLGPAQDILERLYSLLGLAQAIGQQQHQQGPR